MSLLKEIETYSSQETGIQKSETDHSATTVLDSLPHGSLTLDIPDGGIVAWLQVFGSFLLFFNVWGIVNSFGAFQTFYESNLLKSNTPSAISWIGSLQGFIMLNISVLSGPIFDMGQMRLLLFTGTTLVVFGLFMTSLSTQYYQVLLAQGICIGIGGGCLFIPSVAIITTYFHKKRSFATGLAATGSSLGGIIYPVVFRQLQPTIGFPWTTRVIAFIALATLSVSIAIMRQRTTTASKRKLFDLDAWKEAPYVLFVLGAFLGFIGLYIPFFFSGVFAIKKTTASEELAFYLVAIINAASTFGRIIPNYIADKIGPLNVLIPCTFGAGILAFSWIAVHDVAGLIAFAALYGFFSGTFVSLPPSTIASLSPNLHTVGTRLGMAFSAVGFGILIGNPIAGALLDVRTMNFLAAQIFCGITIIASGILFVLVVITRARGSRTATI